MNIDQNKIATLLHIIETANQWPPLKGIHDWAMKELVEVSKAMSAIVAEDKAKTDAEAAQAVAAAQAKVDANKAPTTPPPAYNTAGQTTPARPI